MSEDDLVTYGDDDKVVEDNIDDKVDDDKSGEIEFNEFLKDTKNTIISSSIGITDYIKNEYDRSVNTITNGVDLIKFNNTLIVPLIIVHLA